MAKLIMRQSAINDLTEIWEYTFDEWSEKQADKYYNEIKLACHELANNSKHGKAYTDISKNLLGYQINKHIIFYHHLSDNEIEVIRVLHERMDLKSRLK